MNIPHNYHPINTKNISSKKYNPYLLSNKENINNNIIPSYISSNSNLTKSKREIHSYNDVKNNLNLNITEFNDNTINPKKDLYLNMHRYSSYSSQSTKIINYNNILGSNEENKKTLILDLDETLVHSAFTPFSRKSDLMLTINFDGENRLLYVLKRPYVDEFLKELSSLYEIIIFTASISEYANPLLDLLDKEKCIKYRLFREHCTFDNGIYIKDLKIFDRKINNMIIIDNNPISYDNNVANGIPILSWYEDMNDNELLKLIPILKYMSSKNVHDVRSVINQIVDRNRNEIDYSSINKIISENKFEINNLNNDYKNSKLISKNEYRNMNKSEEPRTKILNGIDKTFEEEKSRYNSRQDKKVMLKNNYTNIYNNNSLKINILNSKYNIHNIYNHAFEQKPSINIDKKDPYGTRISIFSPEEYNILYNKKSYHFPFNRNMYTINTVEENKDNFKKEINTSIEKNNYLLNKYSSNTYSSRRESAKKLESKKEEIIKNKDNDENGAPMKVYRTHSLVELTKKALHLNDKKAEKKISEYESVSKALNKKNFLNGEKKIIYNNYINENKKNLHDYKSDKILFKSNNNNKKYFRNYLQELNNTQKDSVNLLKNMNSQIISLKQINLNNKKNQRISYTNDYENSEKERLLKRINGEKRNNYIGGNYSNQGKNYGYNYISNYSAKNKDSYVNIIKKSIEQNKTNLNMKSLNNSNINYAKNKTNLKMYNNKRYDLLNTHKNKELKNIEINHKSVSYINNKGNNLVNLKQLNVKKNGYYNEGNLIRSSSYVKPNDYMLDNIIENISLIDNSNKENLGNNNNNNLVENLNYRYDISFY